MRFCLNSSLLLVTIAALEAADVLGELLTSLNLSSLNTTGCQMSLVPMPGMNPAIRTDKWGRTCRGNVTVPVCFGYCKSSERGTHKFPHRDSKSLMCMYANPEWITFPLNDCDNGAHASIRQLRFKVSTECRCQKCDPVMARCH